MMLYWHGIRFKEGENKKLCLMKNFEEFRGKVLEEMVEKNERVLKHFFF